MHEVILSMSFEAERFEWAAGDRLELSGHWFGVGGRRFLRPTLEVDAAGETRRLLATLEHKPWAPHDGEEWIAAFEWQGAPPEEIEVARLIVGPDAAVELAPPGRSNGRRRAGGSGHRELAAARAEAKRVRAAVERERDAAVAERDAAMADRATFATELEATRRELEEERLRIGTLESNLRVATRLRDEAREERNAALESRDAAVAEREDAMAQREAAAAELERALAARDAAVAERDAALAELHAVVAEGEAPAGAREAARGAPASAAPPQRAGGSAPRAAAPAPRPAGSPPRETALLREENGPASANLALAETAETRFRSYPLRPTARASESARWVARALAALSLLLFVAAVIALIA